MLDNTSIKVKKKEGELLWKQLQNKYRDKWVFIALSYFIKHESSYAHTTRMMNDAAFTVSFSLEEKCCSVIFHLQKGRRKVVKCLYSKKEFDLITRNWYRNRKLWTYPQNVRRYERNFLSLGCPQIMNAFHFNRVYSICYFGEVLHLNWIKHLVNAYMFISVKPTLNLTLCPRPHSFTRFTFSSPLTYPRPHSFSHSQSPSCLSFTLTLHNLDVVRLRIY